MPKFINTINGMKAVGPYSFAVEVGNILFCSGQVASLPDLSIVPGGIEEEFKTVVKKIEGVLKEAGYEMKDIVKVMVLLADIKDYKRVNELYAEYFKEPFPARSAFQVGNLPLGAKIEIEVIAAK